jgi:hypothetical protein
MPVRHLVSAPLHGSYVQRLALYGLALATLAACSGAPTGPGSKSGKPTPNFIRLQSDAGDYIGGGRTFEYTQANAIIRVNPASNVVHISVQGDELWYGDFAVPAGVPLRTGTYTGATRFPFNAQESPGLAWSGEGRGCNTLAGSFTIDTLGYAGGALTALDLRFEQHCGQGAAALRGTIHWRADDPTLPAGPVDPPPSNLWKPDPTFVPKSGTYVLLASDPGDYIGQGQFSVSTPQNSSITVQSTGTLIRVDVGGFSGEFVGMLGTNPLKKGYYGKLMRYPFHNPVRGGLSWSGNGRGCNTLTGWFAIDQIVYTGSRMTALEMRFEQHCEGLTPALRGAIRWSE